MKKSYFVSSWTDCELDQIKHLYEQPNGRAILINTLARSKGSIDKKAWLMGLRSFRANMHADLSVEKLLSNTTKQDRTECLVWNGSGPRGYAGIAINGKKWYVHRFVFSQLHPEIDLTGLGVLHKCDNPPCINPDHLYAGTQADNLLDITIRGRRKWRLTEKDIPEIRKRLSERETLVQIASSYNVAMTTISAIKRGVTWWHVK